MKAKEVSPQKALFLFIFLYPIALIGVGLHKLGFRLIGKIIDTIVVLILYYLGVPEAREIIDEQKQIYRNSKQKIRDCQPLPNK